MKIVKNKRTFEPIPIDDKKSVYTMKIRCTCIQLENGNYEYLISNLPLKNFLHWIYENFTGKDGLLKLLSDA